MGMDVAMESLILRVEGNVAVVVMMVDELVPESQRVQLDVYKHRKGHQFCTH